MNSAIKSIVCLGAAMAIGACASPQLRPTGEISADGLHRIAGTSFDEVWVRPGLRVASFNRILLEPTSVDYRNVKDGAEYELTRTHSERVEFSIPTKQRERIEAAFQSHVEAEVDASGLYQRAKSPAPGVLQLRAGLADFVSSVPPEEPLYRAKIRSVGHATLIVELRDSVTNELLARAQKHDRAEPLGPRLIPANQVSSWPELDRQLNRWADDVHKLLGQLHRGPPGS